MQCSECAGIEFNEIRSYSTKFNNGGMILLECKKCKNIKNVSAISEDVKHEQYHLYGDPDDKPMRDVF